MNPLISSIEALLHVCINQADRHGLDEIRISLSRAKEIHSSIVSMRKESKDHGNKGRVNPLHTHLDKMFEGAFID